MQYFGGWSSILLHPAECKGKMQKLNADYSISVYGIH